MSYLTQARMAQDEALIMRVAACAASEGVRPNPVAWADERRMRFAATPGWAQAWETALLNEVAIPGEDLGVISDGMILARTQQIIAEDMAQANPPPGEEPGEPLPEPEPIPEPGPEEPLTEPYPELVEPEPLPDPDEE